MSLVTIRSKPIYNYEPGEAIRFMGTEESATQIIKYLDNHKSLSQYVYKFSDGTKYVSIHYRNEDGDHLVYRTGNYFIKNKFRYGGFETMNEKEFNWKYEGV